MERKEPVEVANEPTWRQTAENLRESLAKLTEERDAARKERDAANARAEVLAAANARAEVLAAEAAELEEEDDAAARREWLRWAAYDRRVAHLESIIYTAHDILCAAGLTPRLPATLALRESILLDGCRAAAALRRHAAQLAELLRAEGDAES